MAESLGWSLSSWQMFNRRRSLLLSILLDISRRCTYESPMDIQPIAANGRQYVRVQWSMSGDNPHWSWIDLLPHPGRESTQQNSAGGRTLWAVAVSIAVSPLAICCHCHSHILKPLYTRLFFSRTSPPNIALYCPVGSWLTLPLLRSSSWGSLHPVKSQGWSERWSGLDLIDRFFAHKCACGRVPYWRHGLVNCNEKRRNARANSPVQVIYRDVGNFGMDW